MSAPCLPAGVCRRCARRGWLLSRLGDPLDALAEDPARLWPTLELDDRELIAALAGEEEQRSVLLEEWEGWSSNRDFAQRGLLFDEDGFGAACRHHCRYPEPLRDDPLAPHALAVRSGAARRGWDDLRARKLVAIAGAHSPGGYGARVARAFAAELAAAGVIVAGSASATAAAARAAAIERGGSALYVEPAHGWRDRSRGRGGHGCARGEWRIAELIEGADNRRWPAVAAERTLALLADLVLVVQAREDAVLDLACVDVARSRGLPVAAVPGPVDAPASRGSNRLLATGARVVCSAGEVLDVLFGLGGSGVVAAGAGAGRPARAGARREAAVRRLSDGDRLDTGVGLGEEQRAVFDLLAAGECTLADLGRKLADEDRAAVAVAELELAGLAARGGDGRYRAVPARHLR